MQIPMEFLISVKSKYDTGIHRVMAGQVLVHQHKLLFADIQNTVKNCFFFPYDTGQHQRCNESGDFCSKNQE